MWQWINRINNWLNRHHFHRPEQIILLLLLVLVLFMIYRSITVDLPKPAT